MREDRLRNLTGAVVLIVAWALAAAPSRSAAAVRNEPTGFGKARFGMSVEEVRALYPAMEEAKGYLGAAVVKSPFIERRLLRRQQAPGLPHPVDVELRFWKNRLWVVIVYFGKNDLDTVVTALSAHHGPPRGKPAHAVWAGARTTIIVAGKARWYSVHDNAISREAQAVFMEDFKRAIEERRQKRAGARAGRVSQRTPTGASGVTLLPSPVR